MIVASAPTRLDFGGGWTDVPPFPEERGGFVCNLAIERRATATLTVATDQAPCADPLVAAAVRDLRHVVDARLPDEQAVLDAARLKADHTMAYADAFAASLAERHDAVLWTGDPELLVDGSTWRWRDLRG